MGWLIPVAVLLALLGVLLVFAFSRGRSSRGLGAGETVALDDATLYSETHGLVGRPDRIVREGEWFIPEEWKASKRVSDGHRLQLGTYFILIEENYGVRPPHGVVVLGDGTRAIVKNTEALRSKVLEAANAIRRHRRSVREEIPVRQPPAKCRACGVRNICSQARP